MRAYVLQLRRNWQGYKGSEYETRAVVGQDQRKNKREIQGPTRPHLFQLSNRHIGLPKSEQPIKGRIHERHDKGSRDTIQQWEEMPLTITKHVFLISSKVLFRANFVAYFLSLAFSFIGR